jgi:hypothetical protein
MATVDAIAKKLGVARPGSLSGSVWEAIKNDTAAYLLTVDTGSKRGSIMHSFENMDGLFVQDLISAGYPPAAVHLLAFCQNIALIIIVSSNGEMIIRQHAQTFLSSTSKIPPSAFSPQFMAELQKLRELTAKSTVRPLSDEDISRVNDLGIWHVNNFLTHLQPAGLERGLERGFEHGPDHAHLSSMAKEIGLDLSAIWAAFEAGISPADMAMDASRRQQSWRQTSFKRPPRTTESLRTDDRHRLDKSDGHVKKDKNEKVKSEDDSSSSATLASPGISEETAESVVEQIWTAVTSGSNLDDVRRVCGGLAMGVRVSAKSKLMSLLQTLELRKRELECEVAQLQGFCAQQHPEIVIQTITNAITKKEQETNEVNSCLLRATNAVKLVSDPLLRPRWIKDLNDTEITSFLSNIMATANLPPEDLHILVQPIASLLWKF